MGSEDQFLLIAILEEYIEANTDNYLLSDAKDMLEMIKNPLFKKYKDVIHCGVNHWKNVKNMCHMFLWHKHLPNRIKTCIV